MPVTASWDNEEKNIIRYSFDGSWAWSEFFAAVNQSRVLQDGVNHRVDVILDLGESVFVPEGILLQFRRLASINHPNTGIRVLVTRNSLITVMVDTFTRVYSKFAQKTRLAPTMEEAYAIIEAARTK